MQNFQVALTTLSSKLFALGTASAFIIFIAITPDALAAHIRHASASGGGHSSGHSGGYHGSSHGVGSGRGGGGYGYGNGYDNGYTCGSNAYNYTYDGLPHNYGPWHPVQTGASFSGPAQIDPSQYHYFVQEYTWPTSAAVKRI